MREKLIKFFKSVWAYIVKAKIELIVLVGAFALDLISKAIINSTIELGESVVLIPNFLCFTYTHNYAAAFGSAFGLDGIFNHETVMTIFIVFAFIAIVLFGFFMYRARNQKLILRIAYALIIAGAAGNLVDRMVFGYVRDFIHFIYLGLTIFGSTSFAIFNIADAALVIGVIIFLVFYLFVYKDETSEKIIDKYEQDCSLKNKTEGDVPSRLDINNDNNG